MSDAVYERLRDEIMRDVLPDGTSLNQVHLAERFGVSRIPVREAMRRLQAESLVIATPYHQFVVRRPTGDQILELVDIRAVLEDLALTKRGPFSEEAIGKLREINQQMRRASGEEFVALDRKLHRLISGSESMVTEMISDVRDRIHSYLATMATSKPGRSTATEEHARLIDALEAQDVVLARQVLREHVMSTREFIARRMSAKSTRTA